MQELVTRILFVSWMMPEMSKTTVRGPLASHAARKLPGPELFRLVTCKTAPPRPPTATAPQPSAPGKEGTATAEFIIVLPISSQQIQKNSFIVLAGSRLIHGHLVKTSLPGRTA